MKTVVEELQCVGWSFSLLYPYPMALNLLPPCSATQRVLKETQHTTVVQSQVITDRGRMMGRSSVVTNGKSGGYLS